MLNVTYSEKCVKRISELCDGNWAKLERFLALNLAIQNGPHTFSS